MFSLTRYRTFLALNDTKAMVFTAFLARMPIGMVGLAMLLLIREEFDSFKLAGIAVGAQLIAMAVTSPIQGRIMDRIGPRPVLLVTAIVQPLMLAALMAVSIWRLPFWFILMFAMLSGLFQSPIGVLTRTVWRHRFEHDHERRVAFALDMILVELNFIIGPAVIASLFAATNAKFAYALMIAVVILGSVLFQFSPIMKYWKRGPAAERHLFGPLTIPELRTLYLLSLTMTFSFGVLEVGYPGFAASIGRPAFGGALLSLSSAGSAVGGAIYGGLHLKNALQRQLSIALGIMSIPLFLHFQVDDVFMFSVIAFFAGAAIAPALTANTLLISRYAPDKYATEAFTWSSTFIITGVGTGMAVTGMMIESVSVKSAFLLGAVLVCVAAMCALKLKPSN